MGRAVKGCCGWGVEMRRGPRGAPFGAQLGGHRAESNQRRPDRLRTLRRELGVLVSLRVARDVQLESGGALELFGDARERDVSIGG